jgi:hypothetical protein
LPDAFLRAALINIHVLSQLSVKRRRTGKEP